MTANAASGECNFCRRQNSYPGIIILLNKYAHVSGAAFICPAYPGRTVHVTELILLREEKHILRKQAEQRQMYNKCRTVNTALNNQLVFSFYDLYLFTLKMRTQGM